MAVCCGTQPPCTSSAQRGQLHSWPQSTCPKYTLPTWLPLPLSHPPRDPVQTSLPLKFCILRPHPKARELLSLLRCLSHNCSLCTGLSRVSGGRQARSTRALWTAYLALQQLLTWTDFCIELLVFNPQKALMFFSFFSSRWFWNGAGINTMFCLIPTETILLGNPFRIGKNNFVAYLLCEFKQ